MQFPINQKYLEKIVKALYPNEEIHTNIRNEELVTSPKTLIPLEVDVWVPSLQLSFEFQDTYHYVTTPYSPIALSEVQERDSMKNMILRERHETLIIVPYWWDGDQESLLSAISCQRPELAQVELPFLPIPLNPPELPTAIPNVGELMSATTPLQDHNVLLAAIAEENVPLWWLGEKYDGIRFCWHPIQKQLYSRAGYPLLIPPSVNNQLGANFLEGEFWSGRGCYSDAVRLMNSEPDMSLSRFIAFDVPSSDFASVPFETRYAALLQHIPLEHPILNVVFRTLCDSKVVWGLLRRVLESDAEGVMLRRRNSVYEPGRSPNLFKIKTLAHEAEALVVKLTTNYIKLQLPNGSSFMMDTPKKVKVAKGDVVTFTCNNLTKDHLPSEPSVLRVRKDLTWEDVIGNYINKAPPKRVPTMHEYGRGDVQGIREFFKNFAKSRNFDPLIPAHWYNIPRADVLLAKGGAQILRKFKESLVRALLTAFPRIGFDPIKFAVLPKQFWKSASNRRKLVISIAKSCGFDPLISENWRYQNYKFSNKMRKTYMVRIFYRRNIPNAIRHLFPDIGLPEKILEFKELSKSDIKKILFNLVHKEINPQKPEDWYKYKFVLRDATPRVRSILAQYYNNSWVKCVVDVFPEWQLDATKFQHHDVPHHYWKDLENQRKFFIDFAQQNKFDPLIAQNWYKLSKQQINKAMRKFALPKYLGGISALVRLFPNIGLDEKLIGKKFSHS